MKRHKKLPRGVIIVLLLLLMLAIMTIMVIGVKRWEQQMYAEPTGESTSAVTETVTEQTLPTEPTEATMPTLSDETASGMKSLNVLLVGEDQWDNEEYGRSDTIILCSIDSVRDTVTMVSFLRDLYVEIPGHGSNKLNAAYAFGGVDLLIETLAHNFGIHVDETIETDFAGYANMIDYMGGVEIELTAKEANYLNSGKIWTPDYKNPWNLTEGTNLLTGYQTLAYSRIRYIDSDFVRTERQQTVLQELLARFHDLSWTQTAEAMDCMLEESITSMTDQEFFLYTIGFYPVLMDGSVVSQQIPADGTWTYRTIRGMSTVDADLQANRDLLAELLPAGK